MTSSGHAPAGDRGEPRTPRLIGLRTAAATARPPAVVLLLHGGRENSFAPVRRGNLAALRMSLLARSANFDRSVPVLALRYRYRGWNDDGGARIPDPVSDTLDALARIEAHLGPVPVILVGHSLGGRTAVRAAAYPTVDAVAALAPWLPPGEPIEALRARTLLIAHGRQDRVTNVEHSIAYAERANDVADAVYLKLIDDGHAMLRARATWHRLVGDFCQAVVFGAHTASLDAERLG